MRFAHVPIAALVAATLIVAVAAHPASGAGARLGAGDEQRFSAGLTAGMATWSPKEQLPDRPFKQREGFGAFTLAWSGTRHLGIVQRLQVGTGSRLLLYQPTVRLRLAEPGSPVAYQVGLGPAYWVRLDDRELPPFATEFEAKASIGRVIKDFGSGLGLLATIASSYGLRSEEVRAEVAFTLAQTLHNDGW